MKTIFSITLYCFAAVGILFTFVFFAMQLGWLNVRGSASQRNGYFILQKKDTTKDSTPIPVGEDIAILCRINTLHEYAPITAIAISKMLRNGTDISLIHSMIDTAGLRYVGNARYVGDMERCKNDTVHTAVVLPNTAYVWADSDAWALMKEVFTRDQEIINRAAHDAGVSPRILLGGVIGEQFRFFSSRRESFKHYFEPLKILASLSNTSYGIAGLKPKTVAQIEEHLLDKNSPFYLGAQMEHLFTYDAGVDVNAIRFARITDVKNPYYSYLYVGLFMRQIQTQWAKAGYDIGTRPEVFGTLYNLGFYYSIPKDNPQSGGSTIIIDDVSYTFGDLTYEFYYSGELSDMFPYTVH
jgi:hypothetical protein